MSQRSWSCPASLGGALTLAYSLGGHLAPSETRGAAFGWLALGVQVGTALSPLATGGLAALSLPGAFVFDGALAGSPPLSCFWPLVTWSAGASRAI